MSSFAEGAARLAGAAAVLAGWRPDEFWRATPDELAAVLWALSGEDGGGPPDKAALAALMKEHPDG